MGSLSSTKEVATKLALTRLIEIDGRVTMAFAGSTCAGQPQSVAVPSKCLEARWTKTPMMQLWDRSDGQERERQRIVDDPSAGLFRVKSRDRLVKDVRQVPEEQQRRTADGVRVAFERILMTLGAE